MKSYARLFFLFWGGLIGFFSTAKSQSRAYFTHKIILKYKNNSRFRSIRSKANINPGNQVQQLLKNAGMKRMEPILSTANHSKLQATSAARLKNSAQNLARIFEITYTSQTDAKLLAAKLRKMPGIAYAEPKYLRRMQFTPNDTITNPYQDYHRFEQAWNVTHGSPDLVIAIVDGGVNYLHNELDDKLWINTGEINPGIRAQVDHNGDGMITSTEVMQYLNQHNGDFNSDGVINLRDALAPNSPLLSGSDTDGNGYTDDIFGWDFWQSGGVKGQRVTQDNNPISDATDHGAHVAGIAAAETNNNSGIAGTGFNTRYMAVKAGGIPDDPSTSDDESTLIGFGYEGIIYAAMEGADVINCSWGGGSFSNFENDIINFATSAGALVVAASGNEALNTVDFPSAYPNVLSIGSVEPSSQIASYSNTGYNIDVFATGSGIRSTGFDNDIVTKSGTSMSTPIAAGLAALVKAVHPGWPPLRIAAQIRSSATFLGENSSRKGHGKLDAYRAITTNLPGVRVRSATFNNDSGGKLGRGEEGHIRLHIVNYGQTTSNLSLQLESLVGRGITLNQPSKNIGVIAIGDSAAVEFNLTLDETYDLTVVPSFRLNFTDNNQNYSDFDILQYKDILYDIVDANNITTSFAGDGTIGFTDALAGRGGVGFIPHGNTFEDDKNLLFEGGLMIEADGKIFDAVRGPDNNTTVKDFKPQETFTVDKEGAISDQDGETVFTFGDKAGTASGKVRLETYAFDEPDLRNVVYLKYSITNRSATLPLKDIYAGLFNDWDMGEDASSNDINYSSQDSILYISSSVTGETPIVAVAHLSTISSALAINNFPDTPPADPAIDLTDGFDDTEKKASLKAGTSRTKISSADVSAVTASGPYTLNPNSTLTAGFIYAFGDDINELRKQVGSARKQVPFQVSPTGVIISDQIPESTDLLQNFPNPFSGRTTIRLNLSKATNVKLTLYDVLGRKVSVLRDEQMEAKEYFIPFRAQNMSSGIYFLRLKTDRKTRTIPITYIK